MNLGSLRSPIVALLAVATAMSLSSCEKLCNAGAVTWCTPEEGDHTLNEAPNAGELIRVESTRPRRGRVAPDSREHLAIVDWSTLLELTDASDPNGDALLFEWDLDGDGTFETSGTGRAPSGGGFVPGQMVRKVYTAPADIPITARVSDFPCQLGAPGEVTRRRRLAVVDLDSNHPPVAGFTVSPSPATAGQEVLLDSTSSRDPDPWDRAPFPALPEPFPDSLRYLYNFGDGASTPPGNRRAAVSHVYTAPGVYTIRLATEDLLGADGNAERTISVLDNPSAPTARIRITPDPVRLNRETVFDGTGSSDPDGQIVRYQWHIEQRGVVKESEGPGLTTLFGNVGQGTATLTVTDNQGNVDAETVTFQVVEPPSSSLLARSSAEPRECPPLAASAARGTDFSATIGARPLAPDRSAPRHRGGRHSLRGVAVKGRLRARLLGTPKRRTRAERLLRRFLDASLRTRAEVALERRKQTLTARATALARLPRAKRNAACVRMRITVRPGRRPQGRLKILGGLGAGARLRGGASYQFRLERDGTGTVLGRMRARTGPAKPLPRACRRLAKRGRA